MAIRAPWKGWLRLAMPIVSFLILIFTLAVSTFSVLEAVSFILSLDDEPTNVAQHTTNVRSQLVFFWCTLPFVLLVAAICETFCLWNDCLRPLWILISSATAVGLWLMQLVLWSLCLPNDAPDFCPSIHRSDDWGRVALYLIVPLLVCYSAQITFAAKVVHRQRRTSFRKSDMRGSWALMQEIAASESSLAAASETRLMLAAQRPSESHYRVYLTEEGLAPPDARRQSDASPVIGSVPPAQGRPRAYSAMSASSRSSRSSGSWRNSSERGAASPWSAFSGAWRLSGAATSERSSKSGAARSSVVSPIHIDISSYDG